MTQTAHNLTPDAQAELAAALNQSVAETVVATMLAQNFHWNVKGMAFGPLHQLFQEIYEDHFEGQDSLAERIRALGAHANGQLGEMVKAAKIEERDGTETAEEMIAHMAEAERTLAATVAGAAAVASRAGDLLTEDLCIERGRTHEKFAWMLSAHLQ
ncbi:MAG: DNA starvation/stationary phase protection protein [Pseudomonadota bacterium]